MERDDFVGWIAEKIRSVCEGYIGVPNVAPRTLEKGDVAVTCMFTQFYADKYDPRHGVVSLSMLFYAEGALMLVLDTNEKGQAYVMELEHGKTGWIAKEALEPYE